jgi:hypothetical protein
MGLERVSRFSFVTSGWFYRLLKNASLGMKCQGMTLAVPNEPQNVWGL